MTHVSNVLGTVTGKGDDRDAHEQGVPVLVDGARRSAYEGGCAGLGCGVLCFLVIRFHEPDGYRGLVWQRGVVG